MKEPFLSLVTRMTGKLKKLSRKNKLLSVGSFFFWEKFLILAVISVILFVAETSFPQNSLG